MNTHAHKRIDIVSYVHKKFGAIEINIEKKKTKLEKQDGVTNPPKRIKVEALKFKTSDINSSKKYAIIVGRKTEHKIKNKPLDMPKLSSPSPKPQQPMVELNIQRIEPLGGPSELRKYLEDIVFNKMSDQLKCKLIYKITKCESSMINRLLNNIKLGPASKETAIKKHEGRYVKPDSKKAIDKRKINKMITTRLSPGVVKAKIETPSPADVKRMPQNLQQAVQTPTLNTHNNKLPNAQALHKFPFVVIPRPSPLLRSKLLEHQLNNKPKSNMYAVKKVNPQQYVVVSTRLNQAQLSFTES